MLSGTIIEESLADKSVLDGLKITATKVERVTESHKTPWLKQWTLHSFEVPECFAESVAKKLGNALEAQHAWYADFKNSELHFIVFRGKAFAVNRKNPSGYGQAVDYGLSLGIPKHQLDFSGTLK